MPTHRVTVNIKLIEFTYIARFFKGYEHYYESLFFKSVGICDPYLKLTNFHHHYTFNILQSCTWQ